MLKMVDARVGLIIYRSEPSLALHHIEQYANQTQSNNSVPLIPSWVVVCFADLIPSTSALNVSHILERIKTDVMWAYWWHTPESWRMAVLTKNETLGKQIHRPVQYKAQPPEDLSDIRVQPYANKIELFQALQQLGGTSHRLHNCTTPSLVMYSVNNSDPSDRDESLILARLFRYHYWDLMQYVLPHRWDLVEYMIHAFGWSEHELGTVLETLPKSMLLQPQYRWVEFWYGSSIARIPLISMIKRQDRTWFQLVWWRCYGVPPSGDHISRPFHDTRYYVITPLDCWQLQESCSEEDLTFVFGLPFISWTQVSDQSVDKVQQCIRQKQFKIQFSS
jgi:hypothetical protein